MQFSKYCKRNEATIVKRQKHRRNNDVDSLELPLREVKLDDNKSDEDFFFFSSSDIVGMVKQEFIYQPFIMTGVVNFSSEKIDISTSENCPSPQHYFKAMEQTSGGTDKTSIFRSPPPR